MGQQQPSGVVVAAMICVLEGILWAALGLTGLTGPLAPILAYMGGTGIAVVFLILGIVLLIMGWGLWALQDWARVATIIVSILVVMGGLGGGLVVWGIVALAFILPYVGVLALTLLIAHAWMIYYLLQPDVAAAFAGGYQSPSYPPVPTVPVPAPAPAPTAVPPPPPAPAPSGPLTRTRLVGRPSPVVAWLVVKSGQYAGQQYRLEESTTLGRDGNQCHFVVDDETVSRQHARINFERGQFFIYDLASANGTYINNARIQKQMLMDGDTVRLGNTTLVFKRA